MQQRPNEDDQLPLIIDTQQKPNTGSGKVSIIWRIFRVVRFVPLVLLFGATIGIIALYFQPPGLQKLMGLLDLEPGAGTQSPIAVPANPRPNNNDDIAIVKSQDVVGLGKLIPDGDVRTVATPFGAGDARIARLFVEEGEHVEVGDMIALLDNAENLKAIVENAKTTVSVRKATLNQTKNSVRISRDESTASLQRAQSVLAQAQIEFDRTEALFKRGFTTNAVLDQKRSSRDQAQGEVQRLQATLSRFQSTTLDEQPDVMVATRNLEAAESDFARARSDLSKSQVRAPVSGTILNIHVRAGERPGNTGIVDIGNINKMTAEVEIYQTQIGAVSLDAIVELTAEALPEKLNGSVSKIGLEVGRQKLVDSDPAANTDARVVTVTVRLDEKSSKAAKRFTNLQVIARIKTENE